MNDRNPAMIELTINGNSVHAEEGETLLKCALRHGIEIPHLCNHPSLPPYGACRICMVEVEGMRGFPTSCTTPAASGMVVRTDTPALQELRRNILGLMMLEHPSACLLCGRRDLCDEFRPQAEKVGRTTGCHTCNNKEVCEVRSLSEELGFSELPVPPLYHHRPIERSDPFIDRDLNLCILCGRCVRVCKHQHGTSIIEFVGRSSISRIGEAFSRTLLEADCRFCGSCVDVCPTGSLADRYAKWFGKAESTAETTCLFCDEGCALSLGIQQGKVVHAQAVDPDKPLCVLGRFAVAPFMNGFDRLSVPQLRVEDSLREVSWDEALAGAGEKLLPWKGETFALVFDSALPLEDKFYLKAFTEQVMQSPHALEAVPDSKGKAKVVLPHGVKAVLSLGSFIDPAEAEGLELLILQDVYPGALIEKASVVFPAAMFTEVAGTTVDASGTARPLFAATVPPGKARSDRQIVMDLAGAMHETVLSDLEEKLAASLKATGDPVLQCIRKTVPPAAADPSLRRDWFRGHHLPGLIGGLRSLEDGVSFEEKPAPLPSDNRDPAAPPQLFQIIRKREVAPNNHEIVFYAPSVAKKAQAGQFVIVMADEKSERVPYTLCDWDAEAGTITLVVQEKGRSSRKLALMQAGECAAHIVGPLGTPLDIQNFGTVALLGGCYGIGAHIANAKALKAAGNEVLIIMEARSHYLHYYLEELAAVADELIVTTIDGSNGIKGHAIDALLRRMQSGARIDRAITVGCPFMMMVASKETKETGLPMFAALNPIMLDGTGMCGACRVTVQGETKFACVDGPFFDAHQIDWDELKDRRNAYTDAELNSLLTTEPVAHAHHAHSGGCGCGRS